MARRSDHTREELKELVFTTAAKIIEKDGFGALTARSLAKEVGYTPGTIYNLYESMDDLYLYLNSETLDNLYEILSKEDHYKSDESPADNLKKMAKLYIEFARKNKKRWLMLFSYAMPEGDKLPAWYVEKVESLFEPLETLLMPLFKSKQNKKLKMASRILWSSVHGLCFLEETGKMTIVRGDESLAIMTDFLIVSFIEGLKSDL